MNAEKVVFSFFIVLALTLNFGFFMGELHDFRHHNIYELFATIFVNLVAMAPRRCAGKVSPSGSRRPPSPLSARRRSSPCAPHPA